MGRYANFAENQETDQEDEDKPGGRYAQFKNVDRRQSPTSRLEDMATFGGQMARAPLAGALELLALPYDAVGQAANAISGNRLGYQPIGRQSEAAIDQLGVFPPPPTLEDRAYAPYQAAKFAGGGGAMVGIGKFIPKLGMLAEAPRAQIAGEALAGGAVGLTEQLGGGGVAQTGAGLAAGLTPFGMQGLSRRWGSSLPVEQRAQNLENMDRFGVPATPGGVAGGGFARSEERAMDRDGAFRMRDLRDQQDSRINDIIVGQADNLGPNISKQQTSAVVRDGLENWMERTKDEGSRLYDDFENYVNQDAAVALKNTLGEGPLAPISGQGRATKRLLRGEGLNDLRDAFGEDIAAYAEEMAARGVNITDPASLNSLPLRDIREIRTLVGQQLESGIFADTTVSQKNLSRLYAALSKDLEEGAMAAAGGDKKALELFERANGYWRDRADQVETISNTLGKHGGGDEVYRKLVNASSDGATVLTDIFKSLTPAERNIFRGTFLRQISRARPGRATEAGQTSMQRYLTEYEDLAPEVRELLLESDPDLKAATDFVAGFARQRRKAFQDAGNPSKTGRMVLAGQRAMAASAAVASGNIMAGAAIAGVPVAQNVLDRLITNRNFMEWLAKQGDLPGQAVFNSAATLSQMGEELENADMIAYAEAINDYFTEKR